MSFEALTRIDPAILNEAARNFWEGVDREELVLPQCSVCGKWSWYPTDTGCCSNGSLVWRPLPGTGTVFTHSRVHYGFLPEMSGATPFNVALIELDLAEGVRFVGLLGYQNPRIGDRVKVQYADRPGGKFPLFLPSID